MQSNKVTSTFKAALDMTTCVTFLALAASVGASQRVELPAGSVDGLAAAIASAGADGTVIVKTGVHTESGTVVINSPVSVIGEPGAILECGTSPVATFPIPVIATLDIQHTENVLVQGLQFQPAGAAANCAVLIENSPRVRVFGNAITGFQFGVVLQFADQAAIRGNTLSAFYGNANYGILIVNGASALVSDNSVSGSVFGIFAGDREGLALRNNVSSCFVGMLLCHMPPDTVDISGDLSGAHTRCNSWHVEGNNATGNFWGYEVIDGSHNNLLVNNSASNNVEYDLELAGDTSRYGFFSPASHDDVVITGSQKGLVVKDCGNNDTIRGDVTLVDHTADPCD